MAADQTDPSLRYMRFLSSVADAEAAHQAGEFERNLWHSTRGIDAHTI